MGLVTLPNRPAGTDVRSIGAILDDFDAILSELNGGLDADNLANGSITADKLEATLATQIGANPTGSKSSDVKMIAGEETTSATAFGYLTTPDRIDDIVLPADGLLLVHYAAFWQCTPNSIEGRAQLFLNDINVDTAGFTDNDAVSTGSAPSYGLLYTSESAVLTSSGGSTTTVPTTTGYAPRGVLLAIEAAAGTYDIGVKFRCATAGQTLKVRNRRLRAKAIAF